MNAGDRIAAGAYIVIGLILFFAGLYTPHYVWLEALPDNWREEWYNVPMCLTLMMGGAASVIIGALMVGAGVALIKIVRDREGE